MPTLTVSPLCIQFKEDAKPRVWITRKTKIFLDSKNTAHTIDGTPLVLKDTYWVYFPQ